jgi:competence protein ComGC
MYTYRLKEDIFLKKQILILLTALALFVPAIYAQAPLHDNQLGIISINGSTFIDYVLEKAQIFGLHKDVIKEFEKVFKKNSGSDLRNDFHNIGILVYKGKDDEIHSIGFKTGNFKPENWYGEFQAIAEQPLASQHVQVEIKETNGKKIVHFLSKKEEVKKKAPELSLYFQNSNRIFFGLKDEVAYATGEEFKDQPDAIEKQVRKQTLFINANLSELIAKFKKEPAPGMQPFMGMLAPMSNLYVFYADGEIFIRLACIDNDSAKNFHDMVNGMVSSYQEKLNNDLKELKAPADGKGWLLNSMEYFGRKGTILTSKETIDSIKLVHKENVVMIKGQLPPLVRAGMIPVAAVGTLAAIAIPNFKKARGQAKTKACFANQRVLLGGTEMYNMDHPEMQKEMNDKFVETLVEKKYLRSAPTCPDGGNYISEGDLSGNGVIKCTVHGSVE